MVGRTGSHICPVEALLTYIARRGFDYGPQFQHQDESPLTREQLVSSLKDTLSAAGVEYHRFSGPNWSSHDSGSKRGGGLDNTDAGVMEKQFVQAIISKCQSHIPVNSSHDIDTGTR